MNSSGAVSKPLIALTGATGFIGQYLLRELSRRGYRLRVLLRRPSATPIQSASAVIGDLARPQNMAAALADIDAVIHSAGIAHAMSGLPDDDYRVLNTRPRSGWRRQRNARACGDSFFSRRSARSADPRPITF